jgi:hypothetical protein
MSSQGQKIIDWINSRDPDLASIIRGAMLDRSLVPKSGGGITFIYNPNHGITTDSSEVEGTIRSFIIPFALKTSDDWTSGQVGNLAGYQYEVTYGDRTGVALSNGCRLVPSNYTGDNTAVWEVQSGTLPNSGKSFVGGAQKRRTRKTGGGVDVTMRRKLASKVAAEHTHQLRKDNAVSYNAYLVKVVSLLEFLKIYHSELFYAVLPIVDCDPFITFCLLIEPYKLKGEHLIPDSILFGDGGWKGVNLCQSPFEEFKTILGTVNKSDPSMFYTNRHRLIDLMNQKRNALNGSSPSMWVSDVETAYTELITNNSINGSSPVLPNSTILLVGGQKKLWQDQFRFIIFQALQDVYECLPEERCSRFEGLLKDIEIHWAGDDYAKEQQITTAIVSRLASKSAEMAVLAKFTDSTDFLYMLPTAEEASTEWGSMNPSDSDVYNRNAVAFKQLMSVCKDDGYKILADKLKAIKAINNGVMPAALSSVM